MVDFGVYRRHLKEFKLYKKKFISLTSYKARRLGLEIKRMF